MSHRFGFSTEGADVVRALAAEVRGKTFLITGPTPGSIGAETAASLATGAPSCIILVGRSLASAQATIDRIKNTDPSINVKFVEADLSSIEAVRKAADSILSFVDVPVIHAMINNAGIMVPPFSLTTDGFESQFAINHLSHFLLTNKLMPKLLAAGGARVVNVSSIGNCYSGMNWDDVQFSSGYTPQKAYGQSKTAQILFTVALNKRYASRGVRSFALDPGSVQTGLAKHITPEIAADMALKITGKSLAEARAARRKTVTQGCATSLVAALDPTLSGGIFLVDCQIASGPNTVAPWSLDEAAAERCWALSETLVKEKFDA
ncbi:NAD(P)-binding protein [Purpureocillium lavendulum]|uniref:NAD(P)-binding protein n=1 Tax=Purpureocillium lavendulum TaxID=1247861 RepID=A0AB34FKG7_9HYPO|nr:NAD(P)-binding protein [Purpureocillium lavendulum]